MSLKFKLFFTFYFGKMNHSSNQDCFLITGEPCLKSKLTKDNNNKSQIFHYLFLLSHCNTIFFKQACTIKFKLPTGKCINRRFLHSTDTLQLVVDFAGSIGYIKQYYDIFRSFPRHNVCCFSFTFLKIVFT